LSPSKSKSPYIITISHPNYVGRFIFYRERYVYFRQDEVDTYGGMKEVEKERHAKKAFL